MDATQKETAIDQQQHSCETLICQRHQTILRLLSSAATASTRWRVHELYFPTMYVESKFKTPNYVRFSHTPSTKSTSTCWSDDFMCSIYVFLYLYFIPIHISQIWLRCPSHDTYSSKFKLFPNPDYIFETSEGAKMTKDDHYSQNILLFLIFLIWLCMWLYCNKIVLLWGWQFLTVIVFLMYVCLCIVAYA